MKFITEIGLDGLRRRPAGVYHDAESLHVRCVILTMAVLILQCVQIVLKELIWEQNQVYLAVESSYINPDVLKTPMRLDEVEEAHKALLESVVNSPKQNVKMLVGRPRIRLIYIKNDTCLYPVQRNVCYKRLALDGDIKSEIDTERDFTDVTLEGVQCPPHLNSSNITLKYVKDAQLGYLQTQACFNCKYPLDGYVLDIPRSNVTIQSLADYTTNCLAPLNRAVFGKFVDEATRLIQVEFNFYNVYIDVFTRITVAFEEFDLNMWWPLYEIETGYFLGMARRGNYHGAIDDSKLLIFPALTLILILLRLHWEPKQGRMKRYFLTLITVGLMLWRLYSQVVVVMKYEGVLDALPSVPKNWTRLGRMEQLMNEERHFPFKYVMTENKIARMVGIALVLVSLLHLCQYENYHWHEVALLTVAIRKAFKYSLPFIFYFLLLNFVFAVIGHTLFGSCSSFFSEKTNAFFKLVEFQFLGDMNYQELMECTPFWGEIFFVVVSVVLFIVLVNFTFTYVFGVMTEVRRLKSRQLMLKEHDNLIEKINWPVTRYHRGADLSLEDQLRLVTLYNFLSSHRDKDTSTISGSES